MGLIVFKSRSLQVVLPSKNLIYSNVSSFWNIDQMSVVLAIIRPLEAMVLLKETRIDSASPILLNLKHV